MDLRRIRTKLERSTWLTFGVLGVLLVGCAPADGAGAHVRRVDEGAICVYANDPEVPYTDGPAQTYQPDAPVYVSVTIGCVSACISHEQASCTVTLDGDQLEISSVHEYDEPDPDQGCIALCAALSAVCVSEPLAAGDYQLAHGNDAYSFTVPSTAEHPCL